MKYILIPALALLMACSGSRRISCPAAKKVLNDSSARIYSMDDPAGKDMVYYINPDGKKILLRKVKDFRPAPLRTMIFDSATGTGDAAPGTVARRADPDDPFTGSVRITPKTSYSAKRKETFPTVAALYRSLPSPEFMNNLRIGRRNERAEEEDRNIFIRKAYLYTITLEGDNDLHLLIGNTPSYIEGRTRVFNAEISAIPPDAPEEVKRHMRELRQKAIRGMGDVPLCGRVGYLQSNRRISIRGSLFYDTHHSGSPARCRDVEGESAWEIHPVWDISFDD